MELTSILLISAGIIGAFMVLMFIIAQIIRNNSIVDIGWGLGFCLVAGTLFYLKPQTGPRETLILLMTLLWGIRLALHIGVRNLGKGEDPRYAKWRKEWGKNVVWRAFLQVFMLQGIIMWIISLPIQLVMANTDPDQLNWIEFIGAGIWLTGFLFESFGDLQLSLFLKKPKSERPRFLMTGLWRYTRHPNYFGEVILWWGLFLVAVQAELGLWAVVSPLAITYLLLKVSGIPMLEAPWKDIPEFQEYKKRTNAFFPWFPKSANNH